MDKFVRYVWIEVVGVILELKYINVLIEGL